MIFFRYVLVQLFAYAIDYGIFSAVFFLGLTGPLAANVGAKAFAGIFAFVAHRTFTFDSSSDVDRFRQAFRYFVLLALNIPVSSGLLAVALFWQDQPLIAKLLSDVASTALTFFISKELVFSKVR